MLETILWIVGGLVALSVLWFLFKIFMIVMGVKKVLEVVKEEVEELPKDYAQARKVVQNENGSMGETAKSRAKLVGKVGWRWFKRL